MTLAADDLSCTMGLLQGLGRGSRMRSMFKPLFTISLNHMHILSRVIFISHVVHLKVKCVIFSVTEQNCKNNDSFPLWRIMRPETHQTVFQNHFTYIFFAGLESICLSVTGERHLYYLSLAETFSWKCHSGMRRSEVFNSDVRRAFL